MNGTLGNDVVKFSLRRERQMSTKYSPFQVMYGWKPTHFMDLKVPLAEETPVS